MQAFAVEVAVTLFAFALAQAVSATPPESIDLTIPAPCRQRSESPDEIVVCAPTGESPYRVQEPPPPPPRQVPEAKVKIAKGVEAGVETESADVGGFTSNRAMFRLKIKF